MARSNFNSNIKVGGKSKGFWLELKGASEIQRNLELTKNQTTRLRAFLKTEAGKIVDTAKEMVPIDKGRLRDSHQVLEGRTMKGTKEMISVDITAGGVSVRGRFVDYAAAVHEGNPGCPIAHLRKPARPWLANAVRAHAPGFMARMKAAIKISGRSG